MAAPTPFFQKLTELLSSYIGPEKSLGLVSRQIASLKLAPETLTAANYPTVMVRLVTAVGLYIQDPAQKKDLTDKLNAFKA
jgi:hypothetical protein